MRIIKTVPAFAVAVGLLLTTGQPSAAGVDGQSWEAGADGLTVVAQQTPAPVTPGDRLRRALNLSDEQARRVEQLLAAHRTTTARLRIDLSRARLDAREAMLAATPDRARLDAVARRMGELQGQLAAARFGLMVELRAVLTPEQWTRLQGMMRFGAMMRPGPMGGRGRR
jgi:Spy/CpxP family protein refolding chaperone